MRSCLQPWQDALKFMCVLSTSSSVMQWVILVQHVKSYWSDTEGTSFVSLSQHRITHHDSCVTIKYLYMAIASNWFFVRTSTHLLVSFPDSPSLGMRLIIYTTITLATPRFYLAAMDFSPPLRDKIWEWPGDEVAITLDKDVLYNYLQSSLHDGICSLVLWWISFVSQMSSFCWSDLLMPPLTSTQWLQCCQGELTGMSTSSPPFSPTFPDLST